MRAAAEVMNDGNFNPDVTTKTYEQEELILPLLDRSTVPTQEFEQLTLPGTTAEGVEEELTEISDRLTEICRAVDPTSTGEGGNRVCRRRRTWWRARSTRKVIVATAPESPKPAGLTAEERETSGPVCRVLRLAAEGFSGRLRFFFFFFFFSKKKKKKKKKK